MTLPGDWPLYAHIDRSLPLVSLRVQLPFGSILDPRDRAGLVAMTASMMEEASGGRSTLERSAALDRLAARFGVHPGREWTTVGLDVHRDRLWEALPLIADAIYAPAFRDEDFDRVQARHVTGIAQGLDDNAFVSAQASAAVLFGATHPYGHPIHGRIADCEEADVAGVRAMWAQALAGTAPRFVAVGDFDAEKLADAIAKHFPPVEGVASTVAFPPVVARGDRYFVHSPGSSQTVMRVMMPGPTGTAPDRFAIELARTALGGTFTSRLNRRLREEKGYTYGARLAIASWEHAGMVAASASVRGDATADALLDTLVVLREAGEGGFTEAEVERARAGSLQDLIDAAESRAGLAAAYAGEVEAGRDPRAIALLGAGIEAVTIAEVDAATRAWFDPTEAAILLVGDRDAVMPSLLAVGLDDWRDIDPNGDPT